MSTYVHYVSVWFKLKTHVKKLFKEAILNCASLYFGIAVTKV